MRQDMRQVWLMARHEFTFAGRSYSTGEVFSASPLVAVQLQARRSVAFAKQPPPAPTEAATEPPAPTPRRRGRPPRIMTAAPVVSEVAEAPTPEPAVAQVTELAFPNPNPVVEVDLSLGTYARKDLRAED